MAYNENLANRIREALQDLPKVEENEFEQWIHLCLEFNSKAKSSKKKK